MEKRRLTTPDDINKLTSEMNWRSYTGEDYIYSTEVKIRQRKKLFGYEDTPNTGFEREQFEKCIKDIDRLKAFCEQYGIKYTENSSSDISIESETGYYSDGSAKKGRFKVETLNQSIEFSVSRPLLEEIVRKKSDMYYRNTMETLISYSGEWYERFSGSETLNVVVDKLMEELGPHIENCKKWSVEHRRPNNFLSTKIICYKEHVFCPIINNDLHRFTFKNIGLKDLENEQQTYAVTAVVTERIVNRLKSDPSMAIVTARYTKEYGTLIFLYMKVDIGPQDDLKSWY